ncbi:glycosyl transferase family 2 [Beutenbergia cavernae DSM 12333]|uniref:Glycosyl transferase family 2 n=1 Tax=Beutenbergia cavernae (strain ATCC BAA-8 / DSM 12333 / CCUG 43141 / JCM 11478 / NBRC 16432 / NCIMB 13614 / HKI 0122) TaxID=471853 RepID=C5BZL4_BEUC1|nr:glycosyl transferase family 2 [Beutenbergia cavernae DSM 12333]
MFLTASALALGGVLVAPEPGSAAWWALGTLGHLPFGVIVLFLAGGMVERLGYLRAGRAPRRAGRLPDLLPSVCVQLPMFNELAVARRAILAAAALDWPADRLEIQVLDDSTDPDARAVVDQACADVAASGVTCTVLRRAERHGYKAGALEEGRARTGAELLAIFDADFVPPGDFLRRTVEHFYRPSGEPDDGLALVQARWGHLNDDESALTRAQSLWVDDHHVLQMSWRSARWQFVNFTGTAGVWRASSIEAVGGWRAASLVEDCELSFRHLFAGYRTTFVKEVVAPAELPATFTAYKAQQKRWTQGWAQVQRLHLRTLVTTFRTTPARHLHLVYHMLIPWQWPAWATWVLMLPVLIHLDLWVGVLGVPHGVIGYLLPPTVWLVTCAVLASVETRDGDGGTPHARAVVRRLARAVPYAGIATAMLPHQFSAFVEGWLGPLHSEFERTPKTASVGGEAGGPATARRSPVRIHAPYVLAEAFFAAYQLTWAVVFAVHALWWPALGAAALATAVAWLGYFYGDADGRVLGAVERRHGRRRDAEVPSRPGAGVALPAPPVSDPLLIDDATWSQRDLPAAGTSLDHEPLAR